MPPMKLRDVDQTCKNSQGVIVFATRLGASQQEWGALCKTEHGKNEMGLKHQQKPKYVIAKYTPASLISV